MKSVLISIHPKWCELIASGKKTVEVRKTKPKIETPFKCYIYQTKHGNGKVIGEFVCDKIVCFKNSLYDEALQETVSRSCVPMYDLLVYIGKQDYGYGWHISDLVIYDKPRELDEFCKPIMPTGLRYEDDNIRPPQSWCYIEERTQK